MYEHLLSFDAELRVIWGRKLNLPNILFLLNRYLLVLFSLSLILWSLVEPYDTDKVSIWNRLSVAQRSLFVDVRRAPTGSGFMCVKALNTTGARWPES